MTSNNPARLRHERVPGQAPQQTLAKTAMGRTVTAHLTDYS